MSGHNKWTQIKHQKGAEDAKKAKVFSMLAKTIALEARKAKGNREAPGLRAAIERAKKENFPNENIERALANGVTREELGEVITHLAFYAGWPAAMTAGRIARKVFDETKP